MQRKHLLTAAGALALTAGMGASAQAFENVYWDWHLHATTNVNVTVTGKIDLDPSGAVISETEQKFVGSQNAEAVVDWVVNNPPVGHHLVGRHDLPEVTNVAAALGNSNSISSEVSVQSDVVQRAYGAVRGVDLRASARVYGVRNASVSNAAQAIGNSNSITLDAGESTGGGSMAASQGSWGGCHWRCPPPPPSSGGDSNDQLIISNVDQYARLSGSAYASVYDVEVNGYDNLGTLNADLNRPLVANTAIAAGNVNTITLVNGSIPFPDQNN